MSDMSLPNGPHRDRYLTRLRARLSTPTSRSRWHCFSR